MEQKDAIEKERIMNIVNETTYDLVKLKYILFNKFDQRVFYKILKMEKSESCISKRVTEIGFIYPDATSEKINDFLNEDCLNSSTHFNLTHPDWDACRKYQLFFNFKIKNSDELGDHVEIESALKFEQIDTVQGSDNSSEIAEITTISHENKIIPFNKDELYFVIIYPNNQIPALVRFYDNNEFNLLNIDDKNAIYNSYFENVNIEKSSETKIVQKPINNVSILKMEEDASIQNCLRILSKESFDPETGVYHNDVLNLTVDEHDDLIIDGVNLTEDARYFDFNLLDEKDEPCTEFEFYDQLKEVVLEVIDDDEFDSCDSGHCNLDCSSWIKINDTFIFKVNNYPTTFTTDFIIAKSKYAIIVTQSIVAQSIENTIVLFDLEKEEEMLSINEYGNRSRTINCLNNLNQEGYAFNFNYRLSPNEPLFKIENPIYEINRINKTISGLTADVVECYFQFGKPVYSFIHKNQKVQINKSPITDLLTDEDDEGKYVLVRGVFGNLTKYYYEK